MSEQMREDFERVMPAPRYVYWDVEHQRYMSSGNPLGCIEYQGKWTGWQASHDAQPTGYTAIDMTTAAADGFRDGAESAQALRKALSECTASLEGEMLQKYHGKKPEDMHPVTRRDYDRDMAEINGYKALSKEG